MMCKLATLTWASLALVGMMVQVAHAARDKHAEGELTILPDGTTVLVLRTRVARMGNPVIYAEFEPVNFEDIPFDLAEAPGPDTVFGLGVGIVTAANGEIRTAVVLVRSDPDRPLQIDFIWTDSVTLADGTVVSDTAPFPQQYPPALSLKLSTNDSGVVEETDLFFKKIIIPPL